MPRVAEADRKRARKPKTTTGCGTCKIRRVKCDEAKPFCFRCTSTGRKCDGYSTSTSPRERHPWPASKRRCTKSTSSKAVTLLAPKSRSTSPIAIQLASVFTSAQEKEAFSYFLARTSPQIAGFYVDEFWNQTIPQAAHVDSGIRHAIMALASVHRLFEEHGDADDLSDTFGMQQYQLAIRRHIEYTQGLGPENLALAKGKEGLESYLASSMLFICIEMLQGHFVSAISLTKTAVRLFYEYIIPSTYIPGTATFSAWPLAIFESILARLQFKAVGLVGRLAVGGIIAPRIKKLPSKWDAPPVPAKFTSITEARDWYDSFNWAHAFPSHEQGIQDLQDDLRDPAMHQTQVAALESWSAAFAALLADLADKTLSQRDRNAIAVLQVRLLQTRLSFHMMIRDELADCNPMLWDDYTAEFTSTLDQLETVMQTQSTLDRVPAPTSPLSCPAGRDPRKPSRHLFTLDFGLVAPLYEVGRLCREPLVRRRAINLLYAHPMREGMWDGVLAARACEAQMELEEGLARDMGGGVEKREIGSASDIPRDARIITLLPDFKPGQRWARVFFSRLPAESPMIDRPREWHFEQVIEW